MNETVTLANATVDARTAAEQGLRDRLRMETREPHEALDARFAGMMAGDEATYRRFLGMNRDAHAVLEPVLAASPLGGSWRARGRLEAARRDCAELGIAEPGAVPAPFALRAPSRAEALGIAYVLEGSRLGARFLLRALARAPARNRLPTHYLECSSDAAPFVEMLRLMAQETSSRAEFGASVAAARETFRFFSRLADGYETAGTLGL